MKGKYTTELFINKIEEEYGKGRFTFQNTNYINSTSKIIVTCIKHGDFLISPVELLRHRGEGCAKCTYEKMSSMRIKEKDVFVKELMEIHGDNYDYSNVIYNGRKKKVELKCNICGLIFKKQAYYLLNGIGCPQCVIKSRTHTTEDFIKNSKEKHGEKYDYSKVEYTKSTDKVIIRCNKCKNEFNIRAYHHVNCNSGCPICAKTNSFSKNSWVDKPIGSNGMDSYKLYIIRCYSITEPEEFIKIGITRNSLKQRFHINKKPTKVLPYLYDVIEIIESDSGECIWELEKMLIKSFLNTRYCPSKYFDGMYECFNISILNDITNIVLKLKEEIKYEPFGIYDISATKNFK